MKLVAPKHVSHVHLASGFVAVDEDGFATVPDETPHSVLGSLYAQGFKLPPVDAPVAAVGGAEPEPAPEPEETPAPALEAPVEPAEPAALEPEA